MINYLLNSMDFITLPQYFTLYHLFRMKFQHDQVNLTTYVHGFWRLLDRYIINALTILSQSVTFALNNFYFYSNVCLQLAVNKVNYDWPIANTYFTTQYWNRVWCGHQTKVVKMTQIMEHNFPSYLYSRFLLAIWNGCYWID